MIKPVKNCSTCGHSEEKGFLFTYLFCNRMMRHCSEEIKYESHTCGGKLKEWIPANMITVTFDDAKKMEAWEKLSNA